MVQATSQSASVPDHVQQAIVTKAAGNPFFLEELTWSVLEHGNVDGPLRIPDTIQAVLAARIDRLPPEAKRLLQLAAVIGTEVAYPLLRAVAGMPEDALFQHLHQLQSAELLYEVSSLPARGLCLQTCPAAGGGVSVAAHRAHGRQTISGWRER